MSLQGRLFPAYHGEEGLVCRMRLADTLQTLGPTGTGGLRWQSGYDTRPETRKHTPPQDVPTVTGSISSS